MNAIQVVLSGGAEIKVHEPSADDSAWVMLALLPLVDLQQRAKAEDRAISVVDLIREVMGNTETYADLRKVVAACADMPEEEVGALGMSDFYAVLGSAMVLGMPSEANSPLASSLPSQPTKPGSHPKPRSGSGRSRSASSRGRTSG